MIENRWLWPFELLEQIGEGGMGVVYKARFVKNDRIVAVKLVPETIRDETILARFEREIQILKELRHPNIVFSFGGVAEGKRRFYAMEYVDGGTLDDLIAERRRLTPDQTIAFARQMCSGLTFAHQRGVIHRDIKPGNFLLTSKGTLKLADFGLATVVAANKLTAAGRTLGTFRYMAPEQIRGKPELCAQTDLYAMGVVLFESLTGRPPFVADTPADVLNQHLKKPAPRVREFAPNTPEGLDKIVAHLLRKEIEARPKSASDVARMLDLLDEIVVLPGKSGKGYRLSSDRNSGESRGSGDTVPSTVTITEGQGRSLSASTATVASTERMPKKAGGRLLSWPLVAAAILIVGLGLWGWSLSGPASAYAATEQYWTEMLGSVDAEDRILAVTVLGQLAEQQNRPLRLLGIGLEDAEPDVRQATAEAIVRLGPRARRYRQPLIDAYNNEPDTDARQALLAAKNAVEAEP